jgi:thiopeptide-type bacteriocin biosynthesis protein
MTSKLLTSNSSLGWQPVNTVLFRTPAQPFSRALDIHASLEQILASAAGMKQFPVLASSEFSRFASEPDFCLALRLASPVTYAEMVSALANQMWTRDLLFTVGRYLVRAATRATPFGMFSGVAMGDVGVADETVKVEGLGKVSVAFDFAWLMGIQRELQSGSAEIVENEFLVTNSLVTYEGGRARLAHPDIWGRRDTQDVSLRASPPVRVALAVAKEGVNKAFLQQRLLQGQENISNEAIEAFIGKLVRTGFLLQGARPTMVQEPDKSIDQSETSFIFDVRQPHPTRIPRELLDQRSTTRSIPQSISCLLDWQQKERSSPKTATLQVDASLCVNAGSFPVAVSQLASEAAVVADMLGGCFGYPKILSQHVAVFTERFGSSALLPLMDLLSDLRGIGAPSDYSSPGRSHPLPDLEHTDRRDGIYRIARLSAIAAKGLLAGGAIEVSDEDLRGLSLSRHDRRRDCASIDVSFVPGRTRRADGEYSYYGVLGVQAFVPGGKMLGRFARLLGDLAISHLKLVAEAETTAVPEVAIVELSYFPTEARAANIAVRPRIHEFELNVNTGTEASTNCQLSLSDIYVGEREGEYYLYSPKLGREVSVVQSNMLNRTTAPDALRFLLDVSDATLNSIAGFEWGVLESEMPALPRVSYGRIVLSPARWSLRAANQFSRVGSKSFPEFAQHLKLWRKNYNPPRFVHLITKDNTLLIDLDSDFCLEDIWRAWKSGAAAPVTLIEALPNPSDFIAETTLGQPVLAEVVITVLRKTIRSGVSRLARDDIQHVSMPRPIIWPGEEWISLKLYGPQKDHDEILVEAVSQLRDGLVPLIGTGTLYFIRYADPFPHLRLRVRTNESRESVIGLVLRWASDLAKSDMLADIQIATIRPEIERYGGEQAFRAAETVFCADSDFVIACLAKGARTRDDLIVEGVLHLDSMTQIWGLSREESRRMASHIAGSILGGTEYRRLGRKIWIEANKSDINAPAMRLFEDLRALCVVVETSRSKDILASVLHMHMNRLGIERGIEPVVYGAWRRHLDRKLQGDVISVTRVEL